MIALSIETATATTGVGLLVAGEAIEELVDAERRHTEALAPAVARLLDAHGVAPRELGAVVVDVGPGLFTGLRVGLAFAKAFCVATSCGLFAVSSTDVLAAAAVEAGVTGPLLAVVDARRGEVFAARYDATPEGAVPVGGVRVVEPEALARGLVDDAVTAVGDGAVRYRDALELTGSIVAAELALPSPRSALRLVERRRLAGEMAQHHRDVHPMYLREADAVANFAVRASS